ncbi:MAG: hypothetical protein KAH33_03110 [Candidatus Delongbacteria bacterium]|nr:hypothetical protein [Candidatus Delongbacteria bacterium]
MSKNINIFIILLLTFSLFGKNWYGNYGEGIKEAMKKEKPILFYYYAPKQKASMEFSYVIGKGHLKALYENFVTVRLDLSVPENAYRFKSYEINEAPMFILQDFDPKRKLSVNIVFLKPINIFKGLFEIYSKLGNQFLNLGDIDGARNAFNLISIIPNELGKKAKNTIKEIDKFKKENKIGYQKKDDPKKAQMYFDKAIISIKNGNFDKAYLYLEKVIEIDPKSKLAKKAQVEMNKIYDLVDKSKFVKKKNTKGSKK